jgi:hypothetical protein
LFRDAISINPLVGRRNDFEQQMRDRKRAPDSPRRAQWIGQTDFDPRRPTASTSEVTNGKSKWKKTTKRGEYNGKSYAE